MKKLFVPTLVAACALTALPTLALANHSDMETDATHAADTASHTVTESHAHTTTSAPAMPSTCEFEENLGLGAKGGAVMCLQHELMESGHLSTIDAPTGNFGALTVEALKKWQTEHAIPATGFFGPLTRAALHAHVHEELGVTDAHTQTEATHAHAALDVSTWDETPSVAIKLHEDAMGGYNLEVTPTHFTFAPQHVNGAVVEGEGHAHIYINGTKYGRLYGPWIYLPASAFKKGENNTVRVTLNANNHSDLEVDGKLVEASATVAVR